MGLALVFYGCGSGSAHPSSDKGGTQAAQSDIAIVSSQPGVTPFIASVQLSGKCHQTDFGCIHHRTQAEFGLPAGKCQLEHDRPF